MSKEFELIARISATVSVPQGVTGIGDDCAIIPQHGGLDTLVTTDLLVEGRHFLLEDITPYQLGWKSAAVNISDIAAMGGRPVASFLSIALPQKLMPSTNKAENVDECWIDGFIAGFRELSERFGVSLLGGDTSASDDKLFINVAVLGECPHGQAVMRSGARPGDLVCVTGALGDSAAGLKLIRGRAASGQQAPPLRCGHGSPHQAPDPADILIRRHYLPVPRVEIGRQLAALPGVHAMMDISDGIASDLRHILEESTTNRTPVSLGAEIDLKSLPLSDELKAVCAGRGWDAVELAVSGGEDYELLFTVAPGTQLPEGCTVIGRIIPGDGSIHWIGSDKDFKGFTHF